MDEAWGGSNGGWSGRRRRRAEEGRGFGHVEEGAAPMMGSGMADQPWRWRPWCWAATGGHRGAFGGKTAARGGPTILDGSWRGGRKLTTTVDLGGFGGFGQPATGDGKVEMGRRGGASLAAGKMAGVRPWAAAMEVEEGRRGGAGRQLGVAAGGQRPWWMMGGAWQPTWAAATAAMEEEVAGRRSGRGKMEA